jgi:hypothetical protein
MTLRYLDLYGNSTIYRIIRGMLFDINGEWDTLPDFTNYSHNDLNAIYNYMLHGDFIDKRYTEDWMAPDRERLQRVKAELERLIPIREREIHDRYGSKEAYDRASFEASKEGSGCDVFQKNGSKPNRLLYSGKNGHPSFTLKTVPSKAQQIREIKRLRGIAKPVKASRAKELKELQELDYYQDITDLDYYREPEDWYGTY